MSLLYQFLAYFSVTDDLAATIMMCFIIAFVLVTSLRILLYVGYQTQYGIFTLYAKELRSKEDISGIKRGIFAKSVRDYVRSQNKGVSTVNTHSIVQKHLLHMRLVIWTYSSIHRFISSMETSYLFIGILLAMFTDYPMLFGVFSIIVFISGRIIATVFDYELARDRIGNEMVEYIEREVGAFYLSDFNSAIHRLGTTLLEAVGNQSLVMSSSIKDLGTDLSGVLRLITGDIQKNLENSLNVFINKAEALNEPLNNWKEAISKAADQQGVLNEAAHQIHDASEILKSMSETLESILKSYADNFNQEKDLISEQVNKLGDISGALDNSISIAVSSYDSIQASLSYIEKNQSVLEESLNKYELALKNMTSGLSDGMGSIINYNIESASQSLGERLNDNISSVLGGNNELMSKLQVLFGDLSEQSKRQTQAIINVKEQMDMHFDSLNSKIL